ncbi:hypothetical protein GHK63_35360 [Sinorhizobium meliloti]|nr:hypothetical protein [Sinorhizobium meliloti]
MFASAVFAFCNRRRDRMKLLFFDRSCFVLGLKRLTEDKFRWHRREVAGGHADDRATELDPRWHRYRCNGRPPGAARPGRPLRWRIELLT